MSDATSWWRLQRSPIMIELFRSPRYTTFCQLPYRTNRARTSSHLANLSTKLGSAPPYTALTLHTLVHLQPGMADVPKPWHSTKNGYSHLFFF